MGSLVVQFPPWWSLIGIALVAAFGHCAFRWRRWWLGFLTTLSMAIFLVNAIAWPLTTKTYCRCAIIWCSGPEGPALRSWNASAESSRGIVTLYVSDIHVRDQGAPTRLIITWAPIGRIFPLNPLTNLIHDWPMLEKLGFQLRRNVSSGSADWGFGLYFPHWFVFPFCLPFPLLWLRRFRGRRFRIHHNLCLTCGYSLKGHHPGQKCAECGSIIPQPKPPPRTQNQSREYAPH
jgi:hypothetical protein